MNDKETILIVDDEEINRDLLREHVETLAYNAIEAANGKTAIEKAIIEQPDLIIMDIMMPVMNGYQAIQELKTHDVTNHIPVIIATALGSREEMLKGISMGADDYLSKPVDFEELTIRINNNLIKKKFTDLLESQNERLYKKVLQKTTEIREAFIETTYCLTLAAEYKDQETGEHLKRISHFTKELAVQMGHEQVFVDTIFHSSAMHDIGKVGIPDKIMFKPGPLNSGEWAVMKNHTDIGSRIFKESKSSLLKMAYDIAYEHHENWEGSGYPLGKKKEEISLPARIMAICDQYDALRSKRPYKPPFSHEKTMKIIINGDGRTEPSHFDPLILEAFKNTSNKFEYIYKNFKDKE